MVSSTLPEHRLATSDSGFRDVPGSNAKLVEGKTCIACQQLTSSSSRRRGTVKAITTIIGQVTCASARLYVLVALDHEGINRCSVYIHHDGSPFERRYVLNVLL
jgi:hypothetical protein